MWRPLPFGSKFLSDDIEIRAKHEIFGLRYHVFSFEDVSFAGHGVAQEERGLHVCPRAIDSKKIAVGSSAWAYGFGAYGW